MNSISRFDVLAISDINTLFPQDERLWTAPSDLPARMQKLEVEIAALKRLVNELRAEIRKAHGEVA